jgi:hypothetical protein
MCWKNVVVVTLGISSEYAAYHTVFNVRNIAHESAMACRVFRGVKFGRITEEDSNIMKVSTIRFNHEGLRATSECYTLIICKAWVVVTGYQFRRGCTFLRRHDTEKPRFRICS